MQFAKQLTPGTFIRVNNTSLPMIHGSVGIVESGNHNDGYMVRFPQHRIQSMLRPLSIRVARMTKTEVNEMGQFVPPEAECPNCGENRVDQLVHLNDEDEQIQCSKCGMVYRLD